MNNRSNGTEMTLREFKAMHDAIVLKPSEVQNIHGTIHFIPPREEVGQDTSVKQAAVCSV